MKLLQVAIMGDQAAINNFWKKTSECGKYDCQ